MPWISSGEWCRGRNLAEFDFEKNFLAGTDSGFSLPKAIELRPRWLTLMSDSNLVVRTPHSVMHHTQSPYPSRPDFTHMSARTPDHSFSSPMDPHHSFNQGPSNPSIFSTSDSHQFAHDLSNGARLPTQPNHGFLRRSESENMFAPSQASGPSRTTGMITAMSTQLELDARQQKKAHEFHLVRLCLVFDVGNALTVTSEA